MASLSEIIGWRDALQQARLGGLREVRDQNGETVIYKSDSEMAAAIAYAESLIDSAHRGSPINAIRFTTCKGL